MELDGGLEYGLLSLLCNFHRVAGKWVVGILRNKGSKLRGRRPRLNDEGWCEGMEYRYKGC